MKQIKTLNEVYNNNIDVMDAYETLYKTKQPKGRKLAKSYFIKAKIIIKEHPIISGFLGLLTILPVPTFIVKLFLNKIDLSDKDFMSRDDMLKLIFMKHIYIEVIAQDAYIKIKTI